MKGLTRKIKEFALELGFDIVGISHPGPISRIEFYRQWIADGLAGDMTYLKRGVEKRGDPGRLFEGVLSIISLGISYYQGEGERYTKDLLGGYIARYALGIDYHRLLKERLRKIVEFISRNIPGIGTRSFVDTGPVLEREIARRAGLGWYGKNTTLISPHLGSWFFLGEIFLNHELEYDISIIEERCKGCNRCIDACPTGALVRPYTLNSSYCISYLTVENRMGIPYSIREAIGTRIFGCDRCQEVCPWNSKVCISKERLFWPIDEIIQRDITSLFYLSEERYRSAFNMSPLMRSKRRGLLRNAAIVLGNLGLHDAVPALTRGLHDNDPIVRGHSAWALGKINGQKAINILQMALSTEKEPPVREEIHSALTFYYENPPHPNALPQGERG